MGALYSLAAETADIGRDAYSPVTTDYDPWKNDFTGTINKKVTIKHKMGRRPFHWTGFLRRDF